MGRRGHDPRRWVPIFALLAILLLGLAVSRSLAPQTPDAPTTQDAQARLATSQHTPAPAWPALDFSPTTWDAQASPEYYRVVGKAQIDWTLPAGAVEYAPLDAQGRATGSRACVTYQLMEVGRNRARADSSDLKPSGWGHNARVEIPLSEGDVYYGELWNRSHLLAKSLGGAEQLDNLVTGTRTQNVGSNRNGGESGGMGYCEGLARTWLDAHHDGTLLYSAVPMYLGSELVCRSVVVDLRSSDGTLDQRVEVYNAAAGYEIDYETGAFREAPSATTLTTTPSTTAAATIATTTATATSETEPSSVTYVLNVNTKKFHSPECPHVPEIKPKNRIDAVMTREDVIAQGYVPCKVCNP